jgi:hypothetical protein
MSVVNYVTGNVVNTNKSRANRVTSMLQKKETRPFVSRVEPTLANRFFNLFSNKSPIPVGTLKKTKAVGGRLTNYNKRALAFLSNRSSSLATMNVGKLRSQKTRKTLRKALNKTKRNR